MWGKAGYFAWQAGDPFEINDPELDPVSAAPSSDPAASGETESAAAERAAPRRSGSGIERRSPTAREKAVTLPDLDEGEVDFEAHDTIPAPPWLEDEISTPHNKAP